MLPKLLRELIGLLTGLAAAFVAVLLAGAETVGACVITLGLEVGTTRPSNRFSKNDALFTVLPAVLLPAFKAEPPAEPLGNILFELFT